MLKGLLVLFVVAVVTSASDKSDVPDEDLSALDKRRAERVRVNVRECLQAHNAYRARHGAPPLEWDSRMAAQDQEYAVRLARVKRMKHSDTQDGENLAMRYSWGSLSKYTCAQATKAWYDEVKDYSFSRPGFSMATGHFTQVVWKSSKRLGVGIARNGGFIIIVARYSPPGNYLGQFRQNVGRPRY